ncbi:hypothetical protein EJ03DRAFT_124923 [Teratosphaeria nubilosa]|uniref:Uncharacterized protein n=1 Tax=Teratosphaeria nubilosa TaxID=161662 RepID=A0A6G1LK36_9PEZI|nr:hypothetical protein EJ03DRAFT_124923 [Teratosphaeria nubilosa]
MFGKPAQAPSSSKIYVPDIREADLARIPLDADAVFVSLRRTTAAKTSIHGGRGQNDRLRASVPKAALTQSVGTRLHVAFQAGRGVHDTVQCVIVSRLIVASMTDRRQRACTAEDSLAFITTLVLLRREGACLGCTTFVRGAFPCASSCSAGDYCRHCS